MRKVLTVEGGNVIGIYENGALRVYSREPRDKWILSSCPEFGICYEKMGIETDQLDKLFNTNNDKACEHMLMFLEEIVK